ncbi:MAG: hypothetical protein CL424_05170 [Acidimicrobiaceae bacterium]|nr:hypothetical protein [Acidimicrobiaceae bacterium]
MGEARHIPVAADASSLRWWSRPYRRVPVWGWMSGGLVALAIGSSVWSPAALEEGATIESPATEPGGDEQISSHRSAPTSVIDPSTTIDARTTLPVLPVVPVGPPVTVAVIALPTTTVTPPTPTTTSSLPVTTTVPPTSPPTTTSPPPPPPPPPPTPAPAIQPLIPQSSCDPNYEGVCVPIASDVDCAGGGGNGPAYTSGPVYVVGSDIYGLDRDGDGIGCD